MGTCKIRFYRKQLSWQSVEVVNGLMEHRLILFLIVRSQKMNKTKFWKRQRLP